MHKTKYKEKARKDNSDLELSSVDHNHWAAKTSTYIRVHAATIPAGT